MADALIFYGFGKLVGRLVKGFLTLVFTVVGNILMLTGKLIGWTVRRIIAENSPKKSAIIG